MRLRVGIFILGVLFALFFLNFFFNVIDFSDSFMEIGKWILFAGGIFILLGAVFSFRVNFWFSIPYLIVGLYFLNYGLNVVPLSDFFINIEKWIFLLGGIFSALVIVAFNAFARKVFHNL